MVKGSQLKLEHELQNRQVAGATVECNPANFGEGRVTRAEVEEFGENSKSCPGLKFGRSLWLLP